MQNTLQDMMTNDTLLTGLVSLVRLNSKEKIKVYADPDSDQTIILQQERTNGTLKINPIVDQIIQGQYQMIKYCFTHLTCDLNYLLTILIKRQQKYDLKLSNQSMWSLDSAEVETLAAAIVESSIEFLGIHNLGMNKLFDLLHMILTRPSSIKYFHIRYVWKEFLNLTLNQWKQVIIDIGSNRNLCELGLSIPTLVLHTYLDLFIESIRKSNIRTLAFTFFGDDDSFARDKFTCLLRLFDLNLRSLLIEDQDLVEYLSNLARLNDDLERSKKRNQLTNRLRLNYTLKYLAIWYSDNETGEQINAVSDTSDYYPILCRNQDGWLPSNHIHYDACKKDLIEHLLLILSTELDFMPNELRFLLFILL